MRWYNDLAGFIFYLVFLSILLHFGGMETLVVFFFAWTMWSLIKLRVYVKVCLDKLTGKGANR